MELLSKANAIRKENGWRHLSRKGIRHLRQLYYELNGQFYRFGTGRTCPICGFTGKRFQPFGTPPRKDAQCPACKSLERHRLLWIYLRDATDVLREGGRVLHFSANESIRSKLESRPNVEYYTTDVDGICDVRGDITTLPFSDGRFDVVICSHVLEHVHDDRAAMRELRRTLDTDGCAIIMVPMDASRDVTYEDQSITSPSARKREFGQSDHVRIYGLDIRDRLVDAGFSVSMERYASELGPERATELGIKDEEIYRCET